MVYLPIAMGLDYMARSLLLSSHCSSMFLVLEDFFLVDSGFPGGTNSKESACNAGDLGLIPESGRSPGEGNGYSLQCSCLESSMDRRASQSTVHGISEWDINEQLFFPFLTRFSWVFQVL